ncbi:hypothetical protein [Streptomyces sp. KL2]|uniref:hypothetical protein n=1 Tax=Streptomyces sp. KL2 TaxID=3050126 RepID=UPI00397C05F8
MMMTERGMTTPAAGGSVLAQSDAILTTAAPDLAGHIQAVGLDADTSCLDAAPDAPAYGTKLRWSTPKLTAVAGRAGARLADVFGAKASRNTVLRLVDALPEPQPRTPRVVGVDEYAMRKGRVYGMVLVDVGTRRPVDLLQDREAGTVAAWLAERPGARSSAVTVLRSSPKAPALGHPLPSRLLTVSTSGATLAKPPSGASPAIARACARPPPRRPRRRQRSGLDPESWTPVMRLASA